MKDATLQVMQYVNNDGTQTSGRIYNMSVQIYSESGTVIRQENLFAYMFTNIGDTIARVNGMVIFPSTTPAVSLGDSRSISAHVLDVYKGNIDLAFDNPANANPQVEIVQLFYAESYTK